MALSDTGRNNAVNGLATTATHISLHTADPGLTGASEVTGGSPAYARKAVTWGAASSGTRTSSAAISFDVPATSVSHFGLWTAATGGTFLGADTLKDSSGNAVVETFSAQGTYTLTSAAITIANS